MDMIYPCSDDVLIPKKWDFRIRSKMLKKQCCRSPRGFACMLDERLWRQGGGETWHQSYKTCLEQTLRVLVGLDP